MISYRISNRQLPKRYMAIKVELDLYFSQPSSLGLTLLGQLASSQSTCGIHPQTTLLLQTSASPTYMVQGTLQSNTQQIITLRRLPLRVSLRRSLITRQMPLLRTIPIDDQEKAMCSNCMEDRSTGYPESSPQSQHRLQKQSS